MLKLVLHHQDLNLPRSNIVNVYRRIINLGIFLFVYYRGLDFDDALSGRTENVDIYIRNYQFV